VALGVQEGGAEPVAAAAGFFVHALPGASDAETRRAEENVRATLHPSELVARGTDAGELAERLLDGLGARERSESPVDFRCDCDAQRVASAVRLLGEQEIERTARQGESLEVRCQFCAESYALAPEALRALLRPA
jgi:molecular chaperone Hsp33